MNVSVNNGHNNGDAIYYDSDYEDYSDFLC